MCRDKVCEFDEVLVYGWDKVNNFKRAFDEVLFEDKKTIFDAKSKASGYKSIHFVGYVKSRTSDQKYSFEIQLRTLLQDVWGEMEHKLAYKQKGNQTIIKNSFQLLARDLQTSDMLLAQLKDISRSEECYEYKAPFNPANVFKYEENRLPSEFTSEKSTLYSQYNEYKEMVYKQNFLNFKNISLDESYEKYDALLSAFYKEKNTSHNNVNFNYWKEMEEAFFQLCKKTKEGLEKAKSTYETHKSDSYVAAFRLGQIDLYYGDLVNALRNFDLCQSLLKKSSVQFNRMNIHVNMSLIFWSHGSEYLSAAIDSIEKAILSADEAAYDCKASDYQVLYNAACWYYMECSFDNICNRKKRWKNQTSRSYAEKYYEKLEDIIERNKETKGFTKKSSYDTLAWFNYRLYQETEELDYLSKAKNFAEMIHTGRAPINAYFSHEEVHADHIRAILCDYNRYLAP
jgi:hypothetical protein